MRLGSETNSLVNNLYSRGVIGEPKPVIGMGVTLLGWTDRRPGTIFNVMEMSSKAYPVIIEVIEDNYEVVSGSVQDGSADYKFFPRPEGCKYSFRKNAKSGFWERFRLNEKGRMVKAGGGGIRIGDRDRYYDPSF